MRPIRLTAILLSSLAAAALADDQSDRQKLIGSWELQSASGKQPGFLLDFFGNGAIRCASTQLEGGSKVADFACGTEGTPCEIKTAGKKAMVSHVVQRAHALSRWRPRARTSSNGASRFFLRATSWKWKLFPSFPVEKPRPSSSNGHNSPPARVTIFRRRAFRGTLDMESSVRVRRSILLSVAFAGLLLIIGASAFAIWRNATAAQLRVAALHNAHLEAGNALAALRANVYLTAILTRDYLLDADPNHARQYADQFCKDSNQHR